MQDDNIKVIYTEALFKGKTYFPAYKDGVLIFSGGKFVLSKDGVLTSTIYGGGDFIKK